jgi:hypothetical protein
MFTITTEPARKLVRIKVSGMLNVSDVAELYRQEHQAIKAMGCPLGEQVVIVDLTECPLQLQNIVSAFQESMTSNAKGRAVALVTGSSLARMQARRIMRREGSAMFETMADAEVWLFSPDLNQAA